MTETIQQLRATLRQRRELPQPAMRRALREAAGLSQRELAEAVPCSRAAVGYWESGTRNPRGAKLTGYLRALQVLQEVSAE